jgi:hypothetical protein
MLAPMWLSTTVVSLVLGSALTIEAAQQASSLKILVLAGEGAVNIIQQKTAVRPLVEVRDRNNLPVAGATVTFSVGGGGSGAAFAGGAQTLTVTTNAAGQAAASGLNALSSGAFQIQVSAAYQGQIATAAISQTNFATTAAAAQAGATAGGGTTSGAAGGAAGGGGGISGTTLGIVGAAVGGGALAATQVLGQSSSEDVYSGSVNGQLILTTVFTPTQGPQGTCTHTIAITGSITFELNDTGSSGTAKMEWNENDVAVAGGCDAGTARYSFTDAAVSGGPSALTFTFFLPGASGGVNQTTRTVTFNGSLSGGTIAGTVGIDRVQQGNPNGRGSTTLSVTLQK